METRQGQLVRRRVGVPERQALANNGRNGQVEPPGNRRSYRCGMFSKTRLVLLGLFYLAVVCALRIIIPALPESAWGLVPANRTSSQARQSGIDIIFVHGLGSNPETTWTRPNGSYACNTSLCDPLIFGNKDIHWVIDFFYHDLSPDIQEKTRVFFYNYHSTWMRDSVKERRYRLGKELFEAVADMTDKTPERKIIFVGYSYGGLVIKEALNIAKAFDSHRSTNVLQQCTSVVFLGTPHGGSADASLGEAFAYLFWFGGLRASASLVSAIKYDSVELGDLHQEFMAVAKDIEIINFYEKRETTSIWGLWRSFVVTEQSATLGSPMSRAFGLHTDHRGLNKFGSRNHDYLLLNDKLVRLLSKAIKADEIKHRVYSVPLKLATPYTDRELYLQLIRDKLQESQVLHPEGIDLKQAIVIHGRGGSGKTQLAARYADKHRGLHEVTLWLDARSDTNIRSSFQRCAYDLGLQARIDNRLLLEDDPAVRAVISHLRSRIGGQWLVILDGADDINSGLRGVIPSGAQGTIIITSRDREAVQLLPSGTQLLEIGDMQPHESVSLLLQHLRINDSDVPENIRNLSRHICGDLHHLPLAVHLAGAQMYSTAPEYIEPSGAISFSALGRLLENYQKDYKYHKSELLRADMAKTMDPYNQTIWTVWDSTLDAMDRKFPTYHSRQLLTFLAQMDAGNIQEKMFDLAAASLHGSLAWLQSDLPEWFLEIINVNAGDEWDSFTYRETLKPLVRFGLVGRVKSDDPSLSMHPLVQWRAKQEDHNLHQSYDLIHTIFIAAVADQAAIKPDGIQFWQLAPHFPSWQALDGIESKHKSLLLRLISSVYYETWNYNEAAKSLELLIETIEEEYWADQDVAMSITRDLAETYHQLGRWGDAEKLQLRVTEVYTMNFGNDHPNTLMAIAALARTYYSQGRWDEAEKLQVRVMEAHQTELGPRNATTLRSIQDLAKTYWMQGQLNQAEVLQIGVMDIRKTMLGTEHPDTLTSTSDLASTYFSQGRWSEAEELQRKVLEIRKSKAGPDYEMIGSMSSLAITYQSQGRLDEAQALQGQAVEICATLLGEDHPYTLTGMADLGETYWRQGLLNDAEKIQAQVVEVMTRKLGPEHPNTLTNMGNLAVTYSSQGRWEEAESLQLQVIDARIKKLGLEDLGTLKTMGSLAVTYQNQGRFKDAEGIQVMVLEAHKVQLGQNHPDTLTSLNNLARTYQGQDRWEDAEKLQVAVAEGRKSMLGHDHLDTIGSLASLAVTYQSQGRLEEAETLQVQVKEAYERTLGPNHRDTLTSIEHLVATHTRQGRWEDAETLQLRVVETRRTSLGLGNNETLTSLGTLGSIYHRQNRFDEAEKVLVQVLETRKMILGLYHPDTLASMLDLVETYQSQGRWVASAKLILHIIAANNP